MVNGKKQTQNRLEASICLVSSGAEIGSTSSKTLHMTVPRGRRLLVKLWMPGEREQRLIPVKGK